MTSHSEQPSSNPLFHGDPNTVVDALGLRSSKELTSEVREAFAYAIRMAHSTGHYDGCWRDHWPCVLERLLNEIERLTGKLDFNERGYRLVQAQKEAADDEIERLQREHAILQGVYDEAQLTNWGTAPKAITLDLLNDLHSLCAKVAFLTGSLPPSDEIAARASQPPSVDQNVYESAVKGRQDFRQALRGMRDRAAFGPDTSTDDATWLLCLLQDQEISVSKAREWLREWIRDGVKGPLPDSPALTNTVRCNCAGIAPTMPTFRTEHLPTCPCSGITKRADPPGSYRDATGELVIPSGKGMEEAFSTAAMCRRDERAGLGERQ